MSTTATITIQANATEGNSAALGAYNGNPKITHTKVLSSSDITKVYQKSQTSASPVTFDVNAGLTNAFGTALVFATVKTVVIRNNDGTATLTVGGGLNPLFGTDQYTLKAGEVLPITSPFTVDGTHKNLLVTPSASCAFDILILGS